MSGTRIDPWLVLRTKSRHENVVEDALQQRHILAYLPKQKLVRVWQGRKRAVETPLFPGYLFVRPRAEQYEGMRYIRGSCGFVLSAGSKPATLPEKDLEAVMMLVDSGTALTVDPELVAGRRVKIVAGPLMGVEGELVRVKNREVLVLNVNLVGSSVRVEVDQAAVALL